MNKLELYIHIPFCVRKCAYCDFLSGPANEETREEYVKLLCEEICLAKEKTNGYLVSTIFFGGGTPSILEGSQMKRIMNVVKETFDISDDCEISMEMNPGTVNEEKLQAYYESGINRLSIGLQSVHNEELKMLGRIHSYEEFLESYHMARKAGFQNINVDLISAIPGQTVESWEETLQTIIDLNPEHISAYSLIIEEGTPFYEKYGEDDSELPSEDDERTIYWRTKELMAKAGYARYEISNYAKEGKQCQHNIGYWNRTPYLGFGIGAASFFAHTRYTNPEKTLDWKESFEEKYHGEALSREDEMEEFMFLGLRMMKGVSKEEFKIQFGSSIEEVYGKQIEKLKEENLLEECAERIFLTEKGIDVSNTVFVEFLF